jgi:leader peptidase (prepilin peptidase)/N-methyltransferase
MELVTIFASIPLVYLLVVSIPLAVIDIRQKRLPNVLVLPMLGLELLLLPIASAVGGEWNKLGSAFLIGLGIFILGMVGNFYNLLGMGDVKLLTAITIGLSWFDPLMGFVVPILGVGLTTIFGYIAVLSGRMIKAIAAGPFILFVFILSVITLVV